MGSLHPRLGGVAAKFFAATKGRPGRPGPTPRGKTKPVIHDGAALSLRPYRPASPGCGRYPIGPRSYQPGTHGPGCRRGAKRLSLRRMLTRCPCGVLTHDKPPDNIGIAQSLHDALQHVQLAGVSMNVSVCVATRPGPSSRFTPTAPAGTTEPNRTARTSYVRRQEATRYRNIGDRRTTGCHAARHPPGSASPETDRTPRSKAIQNCRLWRNPPDSRTPRTPAPNEGLGR
jgi:hypothetical protein